MLPDLAQSVGDDVAGNFGAAEQNALAANFVAERLDHRLGDVFLRAEGDLQSFALDSGAGGRADGGDVEVSERALGDIQQRHAIKHGAHPIHTGQDQPLILADEFERLIQGLERARRTNLNERDLIDLGAKRTQARTTACLPARGRVRPGCASPARVSPRCFRSRS